MLPNADGQFIIDAFFTALELRQLDQCATLISQLRIYAEDHPSYQPWCAYLSGVLVSERDHDWAEAERIFTSLLQIDLDLPLRGRILLASGVINDYLGHWSKSLRYYEQGLTLFTQIDHPLDQAKCHKNIALAIYMGFIQGDFSPAMLQTAINHGLAALEIVERLNDPANTWFAGATWNALGLVYGCLGEWEQALDCFQRDLEMCHSLGDAYGVGCSYHNIGEIYHKRGPAYWPQALEAYRHALSRIHKQPPEYEEMDVLANLGYLHQALGDYDQALAYYHQAIACIEMLRSGISSEAARAGFLATTIDTYALTILLHVQLGDTTQAFTLVEQARSRAFLDMLAARSPDLARQMTTTTMTLAEVQAELPPDTLLLEYFTTGLVEAHNGTSAHQHAQRHRFPPARTLLFAVTCDTIRVHDLGLSPSDLQPSHLNNVVERHFLDPSIRRALYDRLIAPVADLLSGRRRVYLAPHGPLHYIPFQALVAPDGDTLLREDGPQLVYAPSATILLRPDRSHPDRAAASCLTMGYNGTGTTCLQFGEDEAQSIARLMDGTALTGSQPKKTEMYAQAHHYRFVHLSCHGTFDPEAPLASSLHLAPDENLTALDVIENLQLNSDLVCLSACESGLSRVRRGDELEGLTRAFFFAGTPVLICSLWRVDERSTRILMERFYLEVQRGINFAEALKHAQIYLRGMRGRQVQATLDRYVAEDMMHNPSQTRSIPLLPAKLIQQPVQQPTTSRKGASTTEADTVFVTPLPDDDILVFADPLYWAPFILIGNCPL